MIKLRTEKVMDGVSGIHALAVDLFDSGLQEGQEVYVIPTDKVLHEEGPFPTQDGKCAHSFFFKGNGKPIKVLIVEVEG